jgi:hypothetical protein
MADVHQRLRDRLHKGSWPTDVDEWPLVWTPSYALQESAIHPPLVAVPIVGPLACEGKPDLEAVLLGKLGQLGLLDHVGQRAG